MTPIFADTEDTRSLLKNRQQLDT